MLSSTLEIPYNAKTALEMTDDALYSAIGTARGFKNIRPVHKHRDHKCTGAIADSPDGGLTWMPQWLSYMDDAMELYAELNAVAGLYCTITGSNGIELRAGSERAHLSLDGIESMPRAISVLWLMAYERGWLPKKEAKI